LETHAAKMAQFKAELVVEMKFGLNITIFPLLVIIFLNYEFASGRIIKQDGGKFIPSQRIPLVPKFVNFPNAFRFVKPKKDIQKEIEKVVASSKIGGIFFSIESNFIDTFSRNNLFFSMQLSRLIGEI
jgi:hypothetical protein